MCAYLNMKLCIFGSTGGSGRELVKQALEQGYEVVAFARSPEKVSDISHKNLKVVKGDARNLDDVRAAISGCDAVLSALGSRVGKLVCEAGTANIVAAMSEKKVKRLIVESAYGAGEPRGGVYATVLRLLIKSRIVDKERMEALLENSNLDWTVVRPSILTNGKKTGSYQYSPQLRFLGVPGVFPKISRADVADFMLRQLKSRAYVQKAVNISQ